MVDKEISMSGKKDKAKDLILNCLFDKLAFMSGLIKMCLQFEHLRVCRVLRGTLWGFRSLRNMIGEMGEREVF